MHVSVPRLNRKGPSSFGKRAALPRWFEAHKREYEVDVLEPALAFVRAVGHELSTFAPTAVAEPRVNGSIFRIQRDTRFSADKQPYKTHLGIRFRDAATFATSKCVLVFYVQLEPRRLLLGAGIGEFPKPILEAYRTAVNTGEWGEKLAPLVAQLTRKSYVVGEPELERVPRGYPDLHPRAQLLRRKGLFVRRESAVPASVHEAAFTSHCCRCFRELTYALGGAAPTCFHGLGIPARAVTRTLNFLGDCRLGRARTRDRTSCDNAVAWYIRDKWLCAAGCTSRPR